jgi:DNA-binding transcriptional LysR family regulator
MTLQQVLDFLAVLEHGGLHAAARQRGQTQPALSRSLRRLESDLGAPLFERHAGGMRPTGYGRRFAEHARRMALEAGQARDALRQMRGEAGGQVHYGISVAPSLLLAPAAIARFRHRHATVQLRSRSGLIHVLAGPLRDAELDFAICPLPEGPLPPGLQAQPLLASEMVLVARRDHPKARVRSLRALHDARFATGAPAGLPGAGIHEVFARAGLGQPQVELQTDGLIDTLAMVAGGRCVAMLPAALLKSGWLRDLLVRQPVEEPLPRYAVALLTRRDGSMTPAAQALATEFEREAAYLGLTPGG